MMRRLITPILLLTLPLAFFCSFFHPATLDIGNAGWLIRGSDNGANALGAHAYWHDPAAGVSLKTTLLNAPEGVPVLFTDSNPLVTLLAKPFASLLPADAQLVGPFILFSLILQAGFAWLLLRHHAPGAVALWAGVVLLAFPPTLANRFVHVNLMAHWTILAASYLFLDTNRGRQFRWWAPLVTVTALTHSYLLIMVGAVWASAMVVCFMAGSRQTRLQTLMHGAAMLALVAMLAWWLGVGGQVSSGSFGAFSMPLDALWNPAVEGFSTLLPAYERSPGRGFEGFHYLGAGGLLLIATAALIAWRHPPRESERIIAQRLRGLVPALVVLAGLAVARLSLPAPILTVLDPIRASGRLFWPVGYIFVLMALLAVFRLRARDAGLVLSGMIAVQVIDLSGMANSIRAQSQEAGKHRLYVRTVDPRWTPLVNQSASIAFMPGEDMTRDLGLFQEIAWRAAKARRPVNNVYAARTSKASTHRLATASAAFKRGELESDRLYVLLADVSLPAIAAPRILKLDGVTIITPLGFRYPQTNPVRHNE